MRLVVDIFNDEEKCTRELKKDGKGNERRELVGMDVGLLLCKGKYCAVSPVHSRNGGYSQKARLWLTATTMSSEQKWNGRFRLVGQ